MHVGEMNLDARRARARASAAQRPGEEVRDGLLSRVRRQAERALNSRFKVGDLVVSRCEHLTPRDIRPILEAPGLIHALYHLANPTATLVVRTPGTPDIQPQFNYGPTGMAGAANYVDCMPPS